MFLVTAKLVEPLNPDQIPHLPGVGEMKPIGPSPAGAPPASTIEGQSGHSLPRKTSEQTPAPENKPATQPAAPKSEKAGSTAALPQTAPNDPVAKEAQLRSSERPKP